MLSKSTRRAGLLCWLANDLPSHVAEKYIYTVFSPAWSMHLQSGMALYGKRMRMRSRRSKRTSSLLAESFKANAKKKKKKKQLLQQLGRPALRWSRDIISPALFHKLLNNTQLPLSDCLFSFAFSTSNHSGRKPRQIILSPARTERYLNFFFIAVLSSGTLSPTQFNISLKAENFATLLNFTGNSINILRTMASLYIPDFSVLESCFFSFVLHTTYGNPVDQKTYTFCWGIHK